MITVLYELFRVMRWKAAGKAEITDEECVACGARDLHSLGERAYRCLECGYEGGSGLAELHESARRQQWAGWSAAKLHRSAQVDLRQAQRFVLSAQGTLDGAARSAKLDLIGLSGAGGGYDGPDETQAAVVSALGDLAEARPRSAVPRSVKTTHPMRHCGRWS